MVVGDVMLDRYITGDITRTAPESGAPILLETGAVAMPGGAANVALNLAAMGAQVRLIGFAGDDSDGRDLAGILQQKGVTTALIDAGRPTICKTRMTGNGTMIMRHDREETGPVSAEAEKDITAAIYASVVKVIILSDYNKGCINDAVIAAALEKHIPVLVDSKKQDLSAFRGAALVTPNRVELQDRYPSLGEEEAGKTLCAECGIDAVLLTRSEDGAALIRLDAETVFYAAEAKQVIEVSGAGDSVIAATALALASGWSLEEACRLGNRAGSRAVEKPGTTTVTREELLS